MRCYKEKQKTELAHYFRMLVLTSQLWDLLKVIYNSIFLSVKNVLVVVVVVEGVLNRMIWDLPRSSGHPQLEDKISSLFLYIPRYISVYIHLL